MGRMLTFEARIMQDSASSSAPARVVRGVGELRTGELRTVELRTVELVRTVELKIASLGFVG